MQQYNNKKNFITNESDSDVNINAALLELSRNKQKPFVNPQNIRTLLNKINISSTENKTSEESESINNHTPNIIETYQSSCHDNKPTDIGDKPTDIGDKVAEVDSDDNLELNYSSVKLN